jgi:ribosome biogenesis GTPase A
MDELKINDCVFDLRTKRFGYILCLEVKVTHGEHIFDLNLIEVKLLDAPGVIFRDREDLLLLPDNSEKTRLGIQLKYGF